MLECIDPNQFGFIPDSCTTFALISMLHHILLIAKLYSLGVKPTVVNWVADFLRDRYQRVKLNSDCLSDFKPVPAGIPQGSRIGPWLFSVMINDLSNTLSSIWKFADDTTVSEIVPKFGASMLQYNTWCPCNDNERYDFRKRPMFSIPRVKTKRFRNSFIMHYADKQQL